MYITEEKRDDQERGKEMKRIRKISIVVSLTVVILLLTFVYGGDLQLYLLSVIVQNSASIIAYGVGIFSDSNCTQPVTSINWGTLEPSGNKNTTVYIKIDPDSTTNVNLNMSTSNWIPQNASKYITLSWNYNNISLSPSQILPTILTLRVSYTISGIKDFSFDITISTVLQGYGGIDLNSTEDSWITKYLGNVDLNFGSSLPMWFGIDQNGIYRSIIKFDISSILNKKISSATLKLYYYAYQQINPQTRNLEIHRLTSPWSEQTITWKTQPPYNSTATSITQCPNNFGWFTFDITQDVQFWASGNPNYGNILFLSQETAPYTILGFYTNSHPNLKPVLSIVYEELGGTSL